MSKDYETGVTAQFENYSSGCGSELGGSWARNLGNVLLSGVKAFHRKGREEKHNQN
jgi:hypothetical protein